MNAPELCTFLEWDSEFFARRIARINQHRLDREAVDRISGWCDANRIDCAYFLADPESAETVSLLEDWGAHFADVRVSYKTRPGTLKVALSSARIRRATAEDLPALRTIARESHYDSRFFFDFHFERELCRKLYETWLTRSCEGFAEAVFVVASGATVSGYLTCHVDPSTQSGRIGLFAVGLNARGAGAGKELASAALVWFDEQRVNEVTVTTQGRNVRAQRLYAGCGFKLDSVGLWYHKWFER